MASEPVLRGPATIVETACPLDCPDACTLAVTVQHGKVIAIDGSHKNPVTNGYICAKVRKFDQRVYGPDRLLYPAVRKGRKGRGPLQADLVGRSARARGRSLSPREGLARRRVDSAVLVRRLERPADAGQPRRATCGAASARRGSPARSARRPPAPPTRRSTARCRRSPIRIIRKPR